MTFTIHGYILEAMLQFAADPREFSIPPVVTQVLVEVTPESIRLVATDRHLLGICHLTPINGFGLNLDCPEPVSLVLPVIELLPLLKDRKYPTVYVTIDGLQVTVKDSSGLTTTVKALPGAEYLSYQRVIPTTPPTPLAGIAVDASLLRRFITFAKAMKVDPHLKFGFSSTTDPITVQIQNLSSFYGLLMPLRIELPDRPLWLPYPRVIRLHDVGGFSVLSGTDDNGCTWTQFEVDEFAEQTLGHCVICQAKISNGWLCGDGGEEVCSEHIVIAEPDEVPAVV